MSRFLSAILLAAFLACSLTAQFFSGPDPRWRTVGAGTLAARPATCAANHDVYICNGAGCLTNGEYHYCTALDTWTVASGAGTITVGTIGNLSYYSAGTTLDPTGNATDGFIWNNALVNVSLRNDAIGTTSTDGIVIENQTAAAVGLQQFSPRLRFRGAGWKTDAVAASQVTEWKIELVPVQAAAAPQARLDFGYAINAGAFTPTLSLLNGVASLGTTTSNVRSG